jgi:hypothetical protein
MNTAVLIILGSDLPNFLMASYRSTSTFKPFWNRTYVGCGYVSEYGGESKGVSRVGVRISSGIALVVTTTCE